MKYRVKPDVGDVELVHQTMIAAQVATLECLRSTGFLSKKKYDGILDLIAKQNASKRDHGWNVPDRVLAMLYDKGLLEEVGEC